MFKGNLKNIKDTLPNKPSELIFLALRDLRKTERLKNIIINMGTWLWKDNEEKVCNVCLAGAVMFQTLGGKNRVAKAIARNESICIGLSSYSEKIYNKLNAIDDLRTGCTATAFRKLGFDYDDGKRYSRRIEPFKRNPRKFKKEMNKLAKDLRKDGY